MASPEGKIMLSFKGTHFVRNIILTCVRWYLAHPLSYRQVEELRRERGVSIDHVTIHRWVLKYSAQLEVAFHHRKRPVGVQLAHGRDPSQGERRVALSLSSGALNRSDH
jgi:hypothetical protein